MARNPSFFEGEKAGLGSDYAIWVPKGIYRQPKNTSGEPLELLWVCTSHAELLGT